MINKVTVTNHLGESVTIELRLPEKSGFLVRGIEGLGPSKANINKTELSTDDGSVYNSAHVSSRNIVFTLRLLPNVTIEDSRQKSYKYFPIKRCVTIRIETDNRICETIGYVESNEPNIFSKEEESIISVICPDAYFYSPQNEITEFSYVDSSFEFPFSNESTSQDLIVLGDLQLNTTKNIYYTGDASVGMIITIHAIGAANNVEITNVNTNGSILIDSTKLIALTGEDIHAGDEIIISTIKGNKSAFLQRDGTLTNILNALDKYPDWFQLDRGDNTFIYTAVSGVSNLQFRIENKIAYEGI